MPESRSTVPTGRRARCVSPLLPLLALTPLVVAAADAPGRGGDDAALLQRELAGDPAREVLMLSVTYGPGGASVPHRHDAQVFVYVLEGEIRMQVDGSPPVTLRPGQVFYEGPGDVHRISANASSTQPARILVFMIKDKARPVTRPVGAAP